ncbi:hypothetical protein HKX48_005850, partial [Thoreauomyces humboldtii]
PGDPGGLVREDVFTNRKSDVYSLGCVVIELLAKARGKDVAKFRKYRQEDRILLDGRWQRNPAIKTVRFNDDPISPRDDSYARHADTVLAYVDAMRKPGVFDRLCNLAMRCLAYEPHIRPFSSGLHSELRKILLPEIDEDARSEFPPLAVSPAGSSSSLVARPDSVDSSEDEGQDLIQWFEQVAL